MTQVRLKPSVLLAPYRSAALLFSTLTLAACGSSGGGGIATYLPPVPTPSPTPIPSATPSPAPPSFQPQVAEIFAEPLYNAELAVAGEGWQHEYVPNAAGSANVRDADGFTVSYDQARGVYLVTAPVAGTGTLFQISDGGVDEPERSFAGILADNAASATNQPGSMRVYAANRPGSRYSYVSYAYLYADAQGTGGQRTIAYGAFGIAQPTRSGEVPTTGTAQYSGNLLGMFAGDAGATWVEGTSKFNFDFGLARLTGDLTVSMQCMMGCAYEEVIYRIADTQFARGGTTFSGILTATGAPSDGSFSGLFAGPGAVELMSQFELPFFNPEYQQWMTAGGVILGKRD